MFNSPTSLTAVSPAHMAGSVNVQVITSAGNSGMSMSQFSYVTPTAPVAAPTVTHVSPATENISGGDSITITGTGFTNAMSVTFGGASAYGFMVLSDTTITVTAPGHMAGSADVQVTTAAGTSLINASDVLQYAVPAQPPAVYSLGTNSGSTAGGTSVAIQGANFTNVTAIWFGTYQATSFFVNSPTSITAVAPAQSSGSVNVQVVTSAGNSGMSMSQFNYVAAVGIPTVTHVSPGTENVSGGDSITITGTGFTNAMSVTFGGTSAYGFTVLSDTTITATAPGHMSGSADVQVSTSAGASPINASDVLQYSVPAQPPAVYSLGTSSGSTAGGTSVAIQGANFTNVTAVWFGTQQATSFVVNSSTSITAVAPAQSAANVNVQVVTSAGNSGMSMSQFSYVAPSPPPGVSTVTHVSPGSEKLTGGDSITITGTGFTNVTSVTFGGTPATSFTVTSSTTISAVAPTHAAGQVDVQVTSTAGTSQSSASDLLQYNNTNTGGGGAGSPGGTPIDWQAAVAQSEADYQNAMNSAKTDYDSQMQSITSVAAAAKAGRDASTAALQADSNSKLDTAIATVKSTTEAASAARDQQLSDLSANITSQSLSTDATYAQDTQAAVDEEAAALSAVNQQFSDDMSQINSTFTTVSASAQQSLDSSMASINSAAQTAENSAVVTYNSTKATADTTYQTATTSALSSLQSAGDANTSAYTSALAAATASLNAQLSGAGGGTAVTTNFDPGVIGANAAYQAAVAAAGATFDAAMTSVVNSYNTAMSNAQSAYDAAMNGADVAYNAAIQTASNNFTTAADNATNTYNDDVDGAVSTFDLAVIQLKTNFDSTTNTAAQAYKTATDKADTDYNQAVTAAQTAYDALVNPALATYNNYKATAPAGLNADILAAAKTWVTSIQTAEQGYPGAVTGANSAHATALTTAIQALAGMGPSGVAGDASTAMQAVTAVAAGAKTAYDDAVSKPITVPSTDLVAYTQAFQDQLNAAVIGYLDTVVGSLLDQAAILRTKYSDYLDSTYNSVNSAVTDTGIADVTLATTIATATQAIQRAKEAGQAIFMQAISGLEDSYQEASENAEIAYRKVLTTADDQRTTANAVAVKVQSLAYSAAGVKYVAAVDTAQITYVDDYADDWDTMEIAFDNAAEDLTHSVATADKNYVTAADQASATWITAVETAATTYNTAADTASTTADSGLHTAVASYESGIDTAWAAAVNAAYPTATDVAAYIAARTSYDNSVLIAWEAADSAAVSLDNSYYDASTAASNANLTAIADASHAEDKAKVNEQTDAMIAAADAMRDYDASYVDAAVKNVKDSISKQTKQAEDTAAAQKKDNDKQATAYLDAITKADTTHQTAVLKADDDIQSEADDFLAGSFAIATQLQKDAEKAANKAADDAIASATADATALKGRLVAHTTSETAKRKADALKAFDDSINSVKKQLSDLQTGPTANLNPYQMAAGNASVPFTNLSMIVMNVDSIRSNLKQVATSILSGLNSPMLGMPISAGASAATLMQQLLGMSSALVPIYSTDAKLVGYYDLLSDAVSRNARQADGSLAKGWRSKSDVDAQLDSGMTDDQWDQFFGGTIAPPDPKSFMHTAINWVIDDAKLQAPGGLGSDILLTAQLVTEVTGTLDPTPLSDGISGSISLYQGDNVAAAVSFGSILVPFGAEKIAKAASRVPVGAVDNAVNGVEAMATTASKQISKNTQVIADAGTAQAKTLNAAATNSPTLKMPPPCPVGGTKCFIAGTQIVMQSNEVLMRDASMASNEGELATSADESDVATLVAFGIAAGLAIVKSKLDVREGQRSLSGQGVRRLQGDSSEIDPFLPSLHQHHAAIFFVDDVEATRRSVPEKMAHRWLSKTLTAAMLVCFALGCWLVSQSAFQSNGNAIAANPVAGFGEPRYRSTNIEDVEVGDMVLARDEHGHEIGYRRVVEAYRRTSQHLRHLKFRDRHGNVQTLQTTDEHPFFDAESNTFVDAGRLKESAKVLGPDGQSQTLVFSKRVEYPDGIPVFNFQVEGFHTYYVHQADAFLPILVHNAPCGPTVVAVAGKTPEPTVLPGMHMTTESVRARLDDVSQKMKGTISQNEAAAKDLAQKMAADAGIANPTLRLDAGNNGKWPHFHITDLDENLHFWFPPQ
jgi:hypothetical protein